MFASHLVRTFTAAAALVSFVPMSLLSSGCATEPVASEPVTLTVIDGNGNSTTDRSVTAEGILAAADSFPEFTVDGVASRDPADLLHGSEIRIPTKNGKVLALHHEGNKLTRDYDGSIVTSVSWNGTYDEMVVNSLKGSITIKTTGLDPEQSERFVGLGAALSLDPDHQIVQPSQAAGAVVVIIAVAGLALLGYLGCITLGSEMCRRAAETSCGAGNVSKYKTICGAGTDFNGATHYGYDCIVECKGAPAPGGVVAEARATEDALVLTPAITTTPTTDPDVTLTPTATP